MLEITAPDYPAEAPDSVALEAFLSANEDLEPEEVAELQALPIGGEVRFGGGAGVLFVVRRTA